MALPAVKPIVRTIPTFKNLRELKAFGEEGIRGFATQVALEANAVELAKRPPNEPTSLARDRQVNRLTDAEADRFARLPSQNSVIDGKWRTLTLTYGSGADVLEAVAAVYSDLRSLTRQKTGRGVRSYYFHGRNKDDESKSQVLNSLVAVRLWLTRNRGASIVIAILGPTVVYRRKLIYNPAGSAIQKKSEQKALFKKGRALSKRTKGTAVDRIEGFNEQDGGLKIRYTKKGKEIAEFNIRQALHRVVLRRNKLKFSRKAVFISYGYVTSRAPLPPDPKYPDKKYGIGPGPYGNIPVMFITPSSRIR